MPWRKSRIAASILATLLFLLLLAFAVRSYGTFDRLRVGETHVASMSGRLLVNDVYNMSTTQPELMQSYRQRAFLNGNVSLWTAPVGALIPVGVGKSFSIWAPAVAAFTLAAAPWIHLSRRFGVRTLLLAMTLVALLLGLAVYASAN